MKAMNNHMSINQQVKMEEMRRYNEKVNRNYWKTNKKIWFNWM